MNKFFNKKVYIVPGNDHKFRTEHDAVFFCNQNGIDTATIEKYDSIKEYDRWIELKRMEDDGKITDLQRQVEFELIPAHVERLHVRDRSVNYWKAGIVAFPTKKGAEAYCRENGIPLSSITNSPIYMPVYKEVVIEKNAVYTADFVYYEDGAKVVEDCKSEYTRKEADYVLRRKLMLHVHGIKVLET